MWLAAATGALGANGTGGPGRPVGEPRAFRSVSILRYDSAPGRTLPLVFTSAPPDLACWQIDANREGSLTRHVIYRRGDVLHALEPGRSAARLLEASEREQALAQIELRRALLLWPDGFAWTGTGLERSADLGALGGLRARFASADDRRPVEIGDVDADGRPRDAYRAITWREIDGRWWPGSAELWHAGRRVWTETLESASTRARFLAAVFAPPGADAPRSDAEKVQLSKLGATAGRRFALACAAPEPGAPGPTWEQAIAEIETLIAAWDPRLRELGLELERKATVELDAAARPRACVLRLTRVPERLPEGFVTTPARQGAVIVLTGPERVTAAHLALLSKAAPAATDARAAYVRFDLAEPVIGQALVVLPFPPAAGD